MLFRGLLIYFMADFDRYFIRNFIGNRVMPVLQPCVSTASEIIAGLSEF